MANRRTHFEAQLSAYLDGELTPAQTAEVEAWLAGDADARRTLAELKATIRAVRSLPRVQSSGDMMEAIRARMERRALLQETAPAGESYSTGLSRTGRWVAAATIVLMTSAAGYVTWSLYQHDYLGAAPSQFASAERKPPREEQRAAEPAAEPAQDADGLYAPQPPARGLLTRSEDTPKALDLDGDDKLDSGRSGRRENDGKTNNAVVGGKDRTAQFSDDFVADSDKDPLVLEIACADEGARRAIIERITRLVNQTQETRKGKSLAYPVSDGDAVSAYSYGLQLEMGKEQPKAAPDGRQARKSEGRENANLFGGYSQTPAEGLDGSEALTYTVQVPDEQAQQVVVNSILSLSSNGAVQQPAGADQERWFFDELAAPARTKTRGAASAPAKGFALADSDPARQASDLAGQASPPAASPSPYSPAAAAPPAKSDELGERQAGKPIDGAARLGQPSSQESPQPIAQGEAAHSPEQPATEQYQAFFSAGRPKGSQPAEMGGCGGGYGGASIANRPAALAGEAGHGFLGDRLAAPSSQAAGDLTLGAAQTRPAEVLLRIRIVLQPATQPATAPSSQPGS